VGGELVLRQLTSPIGVDEGFLLMSFARDRSIANRYVFRRINDLFIPEEGRLPEATQRAQEIYGDLFDLGVFHFGLAQHSDPESPSYVMIFNNYSEAEATKIREYLDLLGVDEARGKHDRTARAPCAQRHR